MQGRSSESTVSLHHSKTEPSKYIIERLLDGSLLGQEGEDEDLLYLQSNSELCDYFKKDILPLLSTLELHLLNQKMIAVEFRSQQGNSALRNNTLPRFLLRYELDQYMTKSAKEQLLVLKQMNEKIAKQKIMMAKQTQPIIGEQRPNIDLNSELRKEIRRLISKLFPLPNVVLELLYLIQQHVPVRDRTPKNFVNFVMFNLYGVQIPDDCSESFYTDIYDALMPDHSRNAKLTIREKNEISNKEHFAERQSILESFQEQRELKSNAPGVSDDDANSIMNIYRSYRRFNLRRKNSENIEILTAQSPEIRYQKIQQYMQHQASLIEEGSGKKHLYQAIVQFYKGKKIDPVQFFDIHVRPITVTPSATTLRKTMGIGL